MCASLKTSYLWPTTLEEGDIYSLRERQPLVSFIAVGPGARDYL